MLRFVVLFAVVQQIQLCLANHKPPNFVVILADDLGYNDLGVYGSPTINTPNIDQLMTEGVRLTQFYVHPLCSPTRAALLTGRLPVRTGTYTSYPYPGDIGYRVFYPSSAGCLLKNETLISEYLKNSSANYSTLMIGKWHVGHQPDLGCLPTHRGFDTFFGLPYSHEEGWPVEPEAIGMPPIPLYDGDTIIEQPVNLSTLTDRYNARILAHLDELAESRRPFFLHYAPEQPHYPLFASSQFTGQSRRGSYGDAVEEMDHSVGLIMAKLRETGLDKNTMVFFASDNGAWTEPSSGIPGDTVFPLDGGSNGLLYEGKGSTYEGGDRVVAAFWWPKKIPRGKSMEVATIQDVLPTILDWARIPLPNVTLDGFSLVPLLTGENSTSPTTFTYYWRESVLYAIRYGPYKCHWYTRPGWGLTPPVAHSPCLLHQLEWNPAETVPINSSHIANYDEIISIFNAEYARASSIPKGPSQYEAQNISYSPCCHGVVTNEGLAAAHALNLSHYEVWHYLGCVC